MSTPATAPPPDPNRPSLRLGSIAPDFSAETTLGPIKSFHEWLGNSWGILFSHPGDFTPVCTTELGEVARRAKAGDWEKRNIKVIGISANGLEEHYKWVKDINEYGTKNVSETDVQYPIIADSDRRVSYLYDMLDYQDATNIDPKAGLPFTIRSVYVIDPAKKIRLKLDYPAVAGRNFDEIIRAIDAIQLGDKYKVATPVNWKLGEDVIVHASVQGEEAKRLFPEHKVHYPYFRTTPLKV
ncbi:thioredoxin-like protein [Lentinula aciculospora]|uniref:Thioredoxin-like protein n=1 Tax=Lentinula aciculospora TaxID=153920 RepID=A0A9W9DY81_9AGAR|nr:thioredoxin-like protein [Lentinula aciculospora]